MNAMETAHKEILRTNRSYLVENLSDIAEIVNRLFEMKTITAPMKEGILEGQNTKTEKKRALLDLLPRRGKFAFDDFFNALIASSEYTAADVLKPGQGQAAMEADRQAGKTAYSAPQPRAPYVASPVEDDLPRFWPDQNYNAMDVQVVNVAEEDHNMRNKFVRSGTAQSGYYCMQRRPRGILLIINNEKFSTARQEKNLPLEDRDGTNVDATSLDMLFEKLSFITITEKNLTREGIIEVLRRQQQVNHDNYDCFVCVILSHGTGGGVFGVDGEVANTQDITDMFNGQNCKTLAGKPKLFFIQACQGTKRDTGSAGAQDPSVGEVSLKFEKMGLKNETEASSKSQVQCETKADSVAEENLGTRADTFVALATTPDYLSYRNTKRGTWFVQAITYIFQKFARSEDLLSMMTKVNLLVSRGEIYGQGLKQVSIFNSSFRKKFFFFPGLQADVSGQSRPRNQMHPTS
ncbi:caspase-3-like isoform X1 [Haliotis rufescens]|uniref:caspase-3-like isoform X1 n=1 Tax=Haliotis rufescens TaxID=6454 RepID=UPI00201F0A55|nr:caspase-3-like isoform X1 [Haliotis rufescens]